MFKCHWYDKNLDNRDMYLLFVMTNTRWFEDDPYILVNTAKQVFYIDDPKVMSGWKVVQFIKHKNIWDLPNPQQNEDEYTGDDQNVHQEDSSKHT